ncbi:hypothetical protein M0805_003305 [Coniferiporia weirii]|nr:hypothetical protein M0805_003305 [Coniferiporia weirii]
MVIATRPLRGSRLSSFYPSASVDGPSLSDLDSAFQLQEYIALLIHRDSHDVETIVANPGRVIIGSQNDPALDKDGKNEIVVDEACWVYEQLRRLAQDLTHPLITSLQQECTRGSCPEMKAGEWLYLCVAHGNDGALEQCCAIDYIIHTLDSATALLNSPRAFPSRITIPSASIRHFSSLARRLGRIFAHAFFHHREAFEAAEAENALYARFLALTSRFSLVPAEFLVIPPRMIPLDVNGASSDSATDSVRGVQAPRLLGASLQPAGALSESPERGGPALEKPHESPRRAGRTRTDTMVFSDAAAFSEELRGAAGSPTASASGLSSVEKDMAARAGSSRDENEDEDDNDNDNNDDSNEVAEPHEDDQGGGGGIRRAISLGLFEPPHDVDPPEEDAASAGETQSPPEPEKAEEKKPEIRPYTLTFSASGTMKSSSPQGISPSNSLSGNPALPSFQAPSSDTGASAEAREASERTEAPSDGVDVYARLNRLISRTQPDLRDEGESSGGDREAFVAQDEEQEGNADMYDAQRATLLDALNTAAGGSAPVPFIFAPSEAPPPESEEVSEGTSEVGESEGAFVDEDLDADAHEEPAPTQSESETSEEESDGTEEEGIPSSASDTEFVMIGEDGKMCSPEPSGDPESESVATEPESGPKLEPESTHVDAPPAVEDRIDEAEESIPSGVGTVGVPSSETSETDDTGATNEFTREEEEETTEEADTSLDPNLTFEEDLADVEKALRD